MSAAPTAPPGGVTTPSPPARLALSPQPPWWRRRWSVANTRLPLCPSRLLTAAVLVLAAVAAAAVAASAVVVLPRPTSTLVEPIGAPADWTLLLGTFSAPQQNPPRVSPGSGTATGMVWGRDLHLRWSFEGLASPVDPSMGIHVHASAAGTNNAHIVVDLFPLTTLSLIRTSGHGNVTVTLTPAGLVAASKGHLYLNVHTMAFPGGELRAQLWPVSSEKLAETGNVITATTAAVAAAGRRREAAGNGGGISAAVAVGTSAAVVVGAGVLAVAAAVPRGAEENPPRDTPATGKAVGMVWGRTLHLRWSFARLATPVDSVEGIHVHSASAGMNNPAIVVDLFPLTTLTQGGTAGHGNVTVDLTPEGLIRAADGRLYLNVHTRGMTKGEIRTQLWPVSGKELTVTGNVTVAATKAVVAMGRRMDAQGGGGVSAAAAVGIAAAVVVVGALLAVAATGLRRRQAARQAEAQRGAAGLPGGGAAAQPVAPAAAAAAAAAALRAPLAHPEAAGEPLFGAEEELRRGGGRWTGSTGGGRGGGDASTAYEGRDDQATPPDARGTPSGGGEGGVVGGWQPPGVMRRSSSSLV
ncbi:hypothetical protein I4F81_007682 [Pyropia yezoensis]|uniref:Uncharacterized protein n=1 Tax=Pyropia yezoensis TaxID=2788 RepID=A0ACC3C4R3_PYRYE|nr:hypothetical protein I4F81_007682 [Neopyropia yezoensis]